MILKISRFISDRFSSSFNAVFSRMMLLTAVTASATYFYIFLSCDKQVIFGRPLCLFLVAVGDSVFWGVRCGFSVVFCGDIEISNMQSELMCFQVISDPRFSFFKQL